jgi:hypothetical protein
MRERFARTNLQAAITVLTVATLIACTSLSPEDQSRFGALKKQYGHRFEFSTSDIYLVVRARTAEPLAWENWLDIYKAFWLTSGRPRTSALIYMNVYDVQGVWQGQFHWDQAADKIAFEHLREHY